MHRILMAMVFGGTALAGFSSAHAGDWMFRRSYYSHSDAPSALEGQELPSRSAIRDPWVGAHPKFAVRGGWRFNSFTINNGTGSTDRTYFRENFYDVNY